jgi:cytosine/adenosine deaminase-related metal-dependent hydrolase
LFGRRRKGVRLASINSKYATGQVAAADAHEVIRAATSVAADALQRDDIGRIRKGARADLVGIRMDRAHLQPVFDPLKSLVWNGTGQDMDLVMVDGEVLIERARFTRHDEAVIIRKGARALENAWQVARDRGIL